MHRKGVCNTINMKLGLKKMLVSSIAKLNAVKNIPTYKKDNAFNGDKNAGGSEKPHNEIKLNAMQKNKKEHKLCFFA